MRTTLFTLLTNSPGSNGLMRFLETLSGEARAVTLTTLVLAGISLGITRVVQGHQGHPPPKWAARRGALVELIVTAGAYVVCLGLGIVAIIRQIDPPIILPFPAIAALLPLFIGLNAFFAVGEKKSWVWVIRHGHRVKKWLTWTLLLLTSGFILTAIIIAARG